MSVGENTSVIDAIAAIQLAVIEAKGAPQHGQQAKANLSLNALFGVRLRI